MYLNYILKNYLIREHFLDHLVINDIQQVAYSNYGLLYLRQKGLRISVTNDGFQLLQNLFLYFSYSRLQTFF